MPEIKNTQTAQKNSKGAAQNSTRKVNIIEIDLTASNNKVESFKKRVKASANNIDGFPDAEILVDYRKWKSSESERCTVDKLCLVQSNNSISIVEGDKRKRIANTYKVDLGSINGSKTHFLEENAERIIVAMHCFWNREKAYDTTLGISLNQFNEHYKGLYPDLAKQASFNQAISLATEKLMEYIKPSINEGDSLNGMRVFRKTDWGVACEDGDGRMNVVGWDALHFFIPFKQELDSSLRTIVIVGIEEHSSIMTLQGVKVNFYLRRSEDKKHLILTIGGKFESFEFGDYVGLYKWVFDNQDDFIRPKYVSYTALYGSDKVDNVVSIAMDVLYLGFEFVRDDRTFSVVYRDDYGVTFHETISTITGASPFNNTHVVSFDWQDFRDWNNMPTEDMCTINKQWIVIDGVATLVDGPATNDDHNSND